MLTSLNSYIAYEFDDATSCPECKINSTVTVVNPVMVLVPYLLDKVRDLKYLKFIKFIIADFE